MSPEMVKRMAAELRAVYFNSTKEQLPWESCPEGTKDAWIRVAQHVLDSMREGIRLEIAELRKKLGI